MKTLVIVREPRSTMMVFGLDANMCNNLAILVEHIRCWSDQRRKRHDRMLGRYECTGSGQQLELHDWCDDDIVQMRNDHDLNDIPSSNGRFFSMLAVEYVSAYGLPHLPQP